MNLPERPGPTYRSPRRERTDHGARLLFGFLGLVIGGLLAWIIVVTARTSPWLFVLIAGAVIASYLIGIVLEKVGLWR